MVCEPVQLQSSKVYALFSTDLFVDRMSPLTQLQQLQHRLSIQQRIFANFSEAAYEWCKPQSSGCLTLAVLQLVNGA
jgi:hypothetical protein